MYAECMYDCTSVVHVKHFKWSVSLLASFHTLLALGETEQVLRNLPTRTPVTCVAFHPHDHMLATVSYGAREQVLIFRHV